MWRGRSGSGWADPSARGSRPPAHPGRAPRPTVGPSRACAPARCDGGPARQAQVGCRRTPRRGGGSLRRPPVDAARPATAPSGSSVERCTTTYSPVGVAASTAAEMVADVLTTTRSPGSRNEARSAAVACLGGSFPTDAIRRTASRRPRRQLGGLGRLELRREVEAERRIGRSRRVLRCRGGDGAHAAATSRARYRPDAARPFDERDDAGHAGLGQGSVGDVLARERVLVHLRAHVARIDGEHPQRRRAPPPAPHRCGRARPWWRRTRPSPRTPRPTASEVMFTTVPRLAARTGAASWTSPSGATTLVSNRSPELVERVVGQRRQRRRTEPAGVVHDEREAGPGGIRPGRRRWSGSVTSPGTVITEPPRGSSGRGREVAASRPSTTTRHPASTSPR